MEQKRDISGGLLAFGLSTATVLAIDFLRPSLPADSQNMLLFEGFIVYVVASAIAGFVSQRSDDNLYSVALNITLLASLLNLGLMLLIGSIIGYLWIVAGYLIGSLLGGFLRQFTRKDEARGAVLSQNEPDTT